MTLSYYVSWCSYHAEYCIAKVRDIAYQFSLLSSLVQKVVIFLSQNSSPMNIKLKFDWTKYVGNNALQIHLVCVRHCLSQPVTDLEWRNPWPFLHLPDMYCLLMTGITHEYKNKWYDSKEVKLFINVKKNDQVVKSFEHDKQKRKFNFWIVFLTLYVLVKSEVNVKHIYLQSLKHLP